LCSRADTHAGANDSAITYGDRDTFGDCDHRAFGDAHERAIVNTNIRANGRRKGHAYAGAGLWTDGSSNFRGIRHDPAGRPGGSKLKGHLPVLSRSFRQAYCRNGQLCGAQWGDNQSSPLCAT
jgi:hypothetical protein